MYIDDAKKRINSFLKSDGSVLQFKSANSFKRRLLHYICEYITKECFKCRLN